MNKLPRSIDTLYVMIVDRSGSMGSVREEAIIGMNEYLATQKQNKVTNAFVSLYEFDGLNGLRLQKVFDMTPLERTRMIGLDDYVPHGGTPLRDAIGTVITEIRQIVETAENPPAVIVQILTDGAENESRVYSSQVIRSMVKELEDDVKGWTFTYAGANQQAVRVAQELGISEGNVIQFATEKTEDTFRTMAMASAGYATANTVLRTTDKKARHMTKTLYADHNVDVSNLD